MKTRFVLKEKNPKGKMDHWLLRVTGEKDGKCITDPGLYSQSHGGGAEVRKMRIQSAEGEKLPTSKHPISQIV